LDWNASAPVLPAVREAVTAALFEAGNPSSIHRYGRAARARLEDAREAVARLVGGAEQGARAAQVTFTSGGTEALALALHGLAATPQDAQDLPPRRILISAVEHPAVAVAAHASAGCPPQVLAVDRNGLVCPEALDDALADCQRDGIMPLVAIQLANNETGVIQPVAALAERVHKAGGLFLCDAVQAAGKSPLSLDALGADAVALSAHKIGGLQGIGALVLRRGRGLRPMVAGGGQERGLRGGTPNGIGALAFGVAADQARQALADGAAEHMAAMRDALQAEMCALAPSAIVYGATVARLPNTLSLGLPGVDQQRQVMALDLAGVAVSAGSACSSGKVAPSAVLLAMGASEEQARQTIRVSLGPQTTAADCAALLSAWAPLARAAAL
jgi:cysteine desulfurase